MILQARRFQNSKKLKTLTNKLQTMKNMTLKKKKKEEEEEEEKPSKPI